MEICRFLKLKNYVRAAFQFAEVRSRNCMIFLWKKVTECCCNISLKHFDMIAFLVYLFYGDKEKLNMLKR